MTHEFRRPCHGQESNRQTADGARAFSLSKSRRQFTYARVCSIGGYVLSSANFCLRGCVNPASLLSLPAIVFRNLLEINFHFRVQGLTLKLLGCVADGKKNPTVLPCGQKLCVTQPEEHLIALLGIIRG